MDNVDRGLMQRVQDLERLTNTQQGEIERLVELTSALVSNVNALRNERPQLPREPYATATEVRLLNERIDALEPKLEADGLPQRIFVQAATLPIQDAAALGADPVVASIVENAADPFITMSERLAALPQEQNMPERPDPFVRRKPKIRKLAPV